LVRLVLTVKRVNSNGVSRRGGCEVRWD